MRTAKIGPGVRLYLFICHVLWVEIFFLSNIGCFKLFKNKYKIKAHSDNLPCESKMNYSRTQLCYYTWNDFTSLLI